MTTASRHVMSASRNQSRSSMLIRGLIPLNSTELAEAVQIGPICLWQAESALDFNYLHAGYFLVVVLSFKINIFKVSKGAKIRNRYNQVQHLTQDTNGKVTNSQLDTTNESQEVSPFLAGDQNRRAQWHQKQDRKNIKDPQKKYRLGTVKKYFRNTSLSEFQTIWTQIRPDVLSGLIWVQKVCKLSYADNSQRVNTNIKRCIKAAFLLISKCINKCICYCRAIGAVLSVVTLPMVILLKSGCFPTVL